MTPELRAELIEDANDFMTPMPGDSGNYSFANWLRMSGTIEHDGITEEEAESIWAEAKLLPPTVRQVEPKQNAYAEPFEGGLKLTKSGEKWLREICAKALADYPEVKDEQIVRVDLLPRFRGYDVPLGPNATTDLLKAVAEWRKTRFSGRAGKRRATRVAPLSVSRVQLRHYPDYFLDENGQVYDAEGMIVTPRFRNQRHWIRLKDHTGKRCERNVFWLMVGAGFIPDPMGRTTQEVSEATAKGKG